MAGFAPPPPPASARAACIDGCVCDAARFAKFLAVLTLESFTSASLGLAVGAVAPSTEAAVAIGPAVMVRPCSAAATPGLRPQTRACCRKRLPEPAGGLPVQVRKWHRAG